MRLRVGTLSKALGKILPFIVALSLIAGFALVQGWGGQLELAVGAGSIVGSIAVWVRPGWRTWLWGTSAVSNLGIGFGMACLGAQRLDLLPQPDSGVAGWVGGGQLRGGPAHPASAYEVRGGAAGLCAVNGTVAPSAAARTTRAAATIPGLLGPGRGAVAEGGHGGIATAWKPGIASGVPSSARP